MGKFIYTVKTVLATIGVQGLALFLWAHTNGLIKW